MTTDTKLPATQHIQPKSIQSPSEDDPFMNQIMKLENNPIIDAYTISRNKKTKITEVTIRGRDQQVINHTHFNGYIEDSYFDRKAASKEDTKLAVQTLLEKGLTQVQVAKRLGISQSLVSNIKRSSK